MPKYTRKELIGDFELNHPYISTAIRRGNLVLTDDLIDDAHPSNIEWFANRRRDKAAKQGAQKVDAPPVVSSTATPQNPEVNEQALNDAQLRSVVTKARIRKFKEEIDLLVLKKEKINEEVIPKEHVAHLIASLSEGMKGAWMRATETFLTQFAAANQMTREDQVYWRKELVKIVNEAVVTGVTDSKKNLRRIAREFSGKKGRGERED